MRPTAIAQRLTLFQRRALLAAREPGLRLRPPTALALERRGLVHADRPTRAGTRVELTALGRAVCAEVLRDA